MAERTLSRARVGDEAAFRGQIATDLNADGTATAQGGAQWWPSTVRAVLRHKATDRLLMLGM